MLRGTRRTAIRGTREIYRRYRCRRRGEQSHSSLDLQIECASSRPGSQQPSIVIAENSTKSFRFARTTHSGRGDQMVNPLCTVQATSALSNVVSRTARLRRNLTTDEPAQKIGTSRFTVVDAERGKPSTSETSCLSSGSRANQKCQIKSAAPMTA